MNIKNVNDQNYVDGILGEWRSMAKIAELFQIDTYDVFEKVFAGKNVIQKKLQGKHSYIMLYKQDAK